MASTLFRGPILQGKKNEAGLTGYNIEQKDSNYTVVIANGDSGKTLDDKLTVACKHKSIKILEIQKEGKSRQEINQFLLGNKIKQDQSIV